MKNYYVRQQFTRFFPAGCRFVATPNAQSLAALNPTRDTLTLALLNGGAGETIHRIALPFARIAGEPEAWRTSEGENLQPVSPCLLRSDSVLEASLPAQSLTTLRIPLALWGEERQPASGDVCLLVPQSNAGLALAASESGVKALPLDADSPAQRWTLGGQPGAWTLTNALGERITWNTGYALRTQQSEAGGQTFLLESVSAGDYFWKIMDPSGQKAFDLAGASPTAGTVVGMYAYGTSPEADTRHFALVPLALTPSTTPDGVEQPSTRTTAPAAIFNLQGQALPRLQRGINLLRQPDGTVRKVIW